MYLYFLVDHTSHELLLVTALFGSQFVQFVRMQVMYGRTF